MSRKKPDKHSSQAASKKRLSSPGKDDARLKTLREFLRTTNEMAPDLAVEAMYDEIATQAKQLGGEQADWELPIGRIYLEARLGLAATTWALQGSAAALAMFQSLLELDRADNVLARNWAIASLLDLNRNDEAAKLLEQFQDSSALWQFAGALLAFRRQGDRDESSQLLESARRCDPGFCDYLLGDKVVRADKPVRFFGKPARTAHSMARLLLPAWRNTPGAAAWARRILSFPLSRAESDVDSLPLPRNELRRLPRKTTTWQVGLLRQSPHEGQEEQTSDHANWMLVIADIDEQQMRIVTILEHEPTSATVWERLLAAFERPLEGEPARPAQLIVPLEELREAWRPVLRELNIACDYDPRPQPVSDLMEALSELAEEQSLPKWSDTIDLGSLPQTDDIWQIAFFHTTMWVSNQREGTYRPWALMILKKGKRRMLANSQFEGEPTPELMLDHLIRAMSREKGGGRPRLIEVADSDCFDMLQPKLNEFGVACRLFDDLPEMDGFCRELARQSDERDKCALADGQRVTEEQMESFYYSAQAYFLERPWQRVPGEIPIRVQCPELRMTRFAVVLGRTGVQLGCCFYETFADYQNTMLGGGPECLRALAVCYDEAMVMSGLDLWCIERNGWPIASSEAYPAVWRADPRQGGRPPTAEELTFVTAALEVIPLFLKSSGEATSYKVDVAGRTLRLQLDW